MGAKDRGTTGDGGVREPVSVTVSLAAELADRLAEFCREHRILADLVVERALIEYFREGDMSH
jgi:hypothetical protein